MVAVPPDVIGETLRWALTHHPKAVVTDVGSIKTGPLEQLRAYGLAGLSRYVGGHPMAGSERSGPLAASAALFDGRPWAVTPHQDSARGGRRPGARAGRRRSGRPPVRMSPDEHDRAVARTSHLPHLLASLVAGRLAEAPPGHLALSGQGVRDVTRVAAGDPELWQQIVTGNAPAVVHLLGEVRDQLDALIAAVSKGRRDELTEILAQGVAGTQAIPGKHGGPLQGHGVGLRLGARPGRRAGAAVRRRRRERGQHRGRAHRPRPGPADRSGRAASSPRTAASTCWPLSNLGDG